MNAAIEDAWTFSDFSPGHSFGAMTIVLDAARLEQWHSIYGDDRLEAPGASDSKVPQGLLVACMMEAYLGLVKPRPPGNIHASQKITFGSGRACLGDTLNLRTRCLEKVERKGRGWVTFEVCIECEGQDLLRGEIRTIWAK